MEFGRVLGPYKYPSTRCLNQYVLVTKYNAAGNTLSKRSIPYSRYVDEYDRGLHRYIDPITKETSVKAGFQQIIRKCANCRKEFVPKLQFSRCCSEKCNKRLKRRENNPKNFKLNYDKQVVINIDGLNKDDDKYYIIIDLDRDKRDHRFIRKKDTTFVISEDENNIPRYRIHYDINKSVRVKLAHIENYSGFKKLFWITETAVLISRRTKKIVGQTLSKTGYPSHSTYVNGRGSKSVCFKIHRLVAQAFIPNPDNKPFVNHIDAVKTNNHYANLEWVTHRENVDHAVRMGLIASGSKVPNAKFTSSEIRQIRYLREVKKFKYRQISKVITKATKSDLREICNYKTYRKE